MVLESTQPLTEMSTRNLPGGKGWQSRKADLTAICEQIVQKMWEPRRLTTIWASTACYRDSLTFYIPNKNGPDKYGLLGCNALYFGDSPTFRRNILPASLCPKYKPNKPAVFGLFLLDSCLAFLMILNLEPICSSETSGSVRPVRRCNPGNSTGHAYLSESITGKRTPA
jgi:hypothetical protein